MASLVQITTTGTLIGLGSALGFVLATPKSTVRRSPETRALFREIRQLDIAILGTASLQYGVAVTGVWNLELERLRYLDWIITTPLLLKTVHTLAQSVGYAGTFKTALVGAIVMVTAGYLARFVDRTQRRLWWAVGMLALLVVLVEVYRWCEFLKARGVRLGALPWFFYVGWSLYGINFLNPDPASRSVLFNVLDFINKAVYSLVLQTVTRRTATVVARQQQQQQLF